MSFLILNLPLKSQQCEAPQWHIASTLKTEYFDSNNNDALIATLNINQIALLTTFLDSIETENIETLANAYKTGVKLGMRLAIESTTAEDDWR
ncbi:MAG: hypothetical protein RSA24_06400 [Clostridia bacterium]